MDSVNPDNITLSLTSGPSNNFVTPLLTDMYQLTMAYAYWKSDRQNEEASFDLFFRKCPFKGQFTIFAGLSEVLKFVEAFGFSEEEIDYLRTVMPGCEEGYFDYLKSLNASGVKVHALPEGTVCFPRVPMLQVSGPLGVCQLLETTLLNLVNFPSLVATQAARMKLAAGPGKVLMEFGLRRAQGPDGGMSASKYAVMGGFDATSNVQAGFKHGITIKGTHAHSFVLSYVGFEDIKNPMLAPKSGGDPVNLVDRVLGKREELGYVHTNTGELAAFTAYALSFPDGFLALIDSYDTERSGNLNFVLVALALEELGYKPVGVRLDSGDLAYLSKSVKETWRQVAEQLNKPFFNDCKVVASNDINEKSLHELNEADHQIDIFGIGTHLATCQMQPALGCVYKLTELNNKPRIKLSNDLIKVSVPGKKKLFRLYGEDGLALADLMLTSDEEPPAVGKEVLCLSPGDSSKRVHIIPSQVEELHTLVFDGGLTGSIPDLAESKARVQEQMSKFWPEHFGLQIPNNNVYKVSVSLKLFDLMKNLWEKETPIKVLK